MRKRCGQFGMSLMEVLVALATILILISALIGVGSGIKARAQADQAKAMLETLCTALEQYHSDFGDFPFDTDTTIPEDGVLDNYVEADLIVDIDPVNDGSITGTLPVHTGVKPVDPTPIPSASSAALFYFLDRNPSSRAIVETVANTLVTNKDDSGVDIKITIGTNPEIDLPRYIDPWKTSIRYEYLPGTAFPVLTSAGPDRIFDTPDDITSK